MDANSPFTEQEMAMLRPVFLTSGREHLETMGRLQGELPGLVPDGDALKQFHRAIHSLKGAALQMGFLQIGGLAGLLERVVLVLQESMPDDDGRWQTLLQQGHTALDTALTATEQETGFTPAGELVTELEQWLAQCEQSASGEQCASG
ncbi:MAG: Hpt domain-containing protein [Candidatus Eisenbacteria sp.]|nr:Hpt domain-containing protein [Candidatus Eisenbacteria bacterium]